MDRLRRSHLDWRLVDKDAEAREGKEEAHPDEPRAFSALQRSMRSIHLSSIQTAQLAAVQGAKLENLTPHGTELKKLTEALQAIARSFNYPVDFSVLVDAQKQIIVPSLPATGDVKLEWAEALWNSINYSSIADTLQSIADAIKRNWGSWTDFIAQISEQWPALKRGIPSNLAGFDILDSGFDHLDMLVTISLEEGIPLSWVPGREIVVALLDAPDSEARLATLTRHQADVLGDCTSALASVDDEWATQCQDAVGALRAGYHGPAQSHASNICDSIVREQYGSRGGSKYVKKMARSEIYDSPVQLFAETLSLMPSVLAFASWFPASGEPPPEHFSRHATSHAVGRSGVVTPHHALVAVMLATSLTVQYAPTARTDQILHR